MNFNPCYILCDEICRLLFDDGKKEEEAWKNAFFDGYSIASHAYTHTRLLYFNHSIIVVH
jgi:hypothetical protein